MILNPLSPVLCDRHRYADHIVPLPGTLLATLLLFPNLPSHSVRRSIVNALYPPEDRGSPPRIHVRCKAASAPANRVSSSAQIAAHHSLAAHSIARSYSTGMGQYCTFLPFFSTEYMLQILNRTTLSFGSICSRVFLCSSTRACVRRILEPWLLGLTSIHTVEIGSGVRKVESESLVAG